MNKRVDWSTATPKQVFDPTLKASDMTMSEFDAREQRASELIQEMVKKISQAIERIPNEGSP